MTEREKLVELKDVQITFGKGKKKFVAVDDVSFDIYKGETFSLVGESGSGKTTIGRAILRLNPISAGEIYFKGQKISGKISKEMDEEVIRKCQMIFQDPYASLNPRMTVTDIIGEGIDIHGLYSGKERQKRIYELLELVGLSREHASRFPHEFSGGQRQRIGVARALAIEPKFIVCDEPISALDVSIQAQVVNLLEDLQENLGLTYLFIAHDLSMVKHISDRIAVMYLGAIVETAPSHELYENPLHPYTQALLSAVPIPDPTVEKAKKRIILEGEVPSPINPSPGCKFQARCRYAQPICKEETPNLKEMKPHHYVACHMVK